MAISVSKINGVVVKGGSGGSNNGISDAPDNGSFYARRNSGWALIPNITEAPTDGNQYVRQNSNWSIIAPGLITETLTVSAFQALNGVYTPSTTYKITGADINLYGGTEIYLTTNNEGLLNERGLGKFYNPKYDQTVAGFNVWTNLSDWTVTPTGGTWTPQYQPENIIGQNGETGKLFTTINGTKFIPLTGDWSAVTSFTGVDTGASATLNSFTPNSYLAGSKVHWGGKTWTRNSDSINGLVGVASDIYTLDNSWTLIPFIGNETEYNVVYDEIKYDVENDSIVYRNEHDSNIVLFNQNYILGENSIKCFMWGNTYSSPNYKGIGGQKISNSFNENINFRGSIQQNLSFDNNSFQNFLTFENNSFQSNLIFNNSYQQNFKFDNSYQQNFKFDNSYQSDLIFYNSSYQNNLIFSKSDQRLILFENSYQNNLTFENNSSHYRLVFISSHQQNLIFNNSYQSILTFENNSYQIKLKMNNSYQINLTSISNYQSGLSFDNYQFDRTSSPLTNEEQLEFKGDLSTITSLNNTTDKIYVKQDNQVKEIVITDLGFIPLTGTNNMGGFFQTGLDNDPYLTRISMNGSLLSQSVKDPTHDTKITIFPDSFYFEIGEDNTLNRYFSSAVDSPYIFGNDILIINESWNIIESKIDAATGSYNPLITKRYADDHYAPIGGGGNTIFYFSYASLPVTAIPLNTILYELNNTYKCIISYTKSGSTLTDFATDFAADNWALVAEGKMFRSISSTGAVSIDLSLGNAVQITMTGNITSFTCNNMMKGHSYTFKFIRTTSLYTITGLSGSLFKSSYGIQPTIMSISAWVSGTIYGTGSVVSNGGAFWKRTNITAAFVATDAPVENTFWNQTDMEDMWFGYVDNDSRMLINSQNLIEKADNLGW